MKITKAIEILDHYNDPLHQFTVKETKEAAKLGIEALVRFRNERINPGAYKGLPLPSETPEGEKDTAFRHHGHTHNGRRSIK